MLFPCIESSELVCKGEELCTASARATPGRGFRSKPSMADATVKGGSEGSVEFDDSAEVGSVENRMTVVRSLVEDIAHNGEGGRFQQEVKVDGGVWRVTVEQLPG